MTKKEKKWREEHDIYEQMSIIKSWADYEECDYIFSCNSIETAIKLFMFLQFDLDIEFVKDAYELIENELEENGKSKTLEKCLKFDNQNKTSFFTSISNI